MYKWKRKAECKSLKSRKNTQIQINTSTNHRDAQSRHEVLTTNMLVELEPIAAFYTRGREGCSPSHHKVLMQGLNMRKSALEGWSLSVHESWQFWPWWDMHERHDRKAEMWWALLLTQQEQTPAAISKTSWKQEEHPVKAVQHVVVLKSAQSQALDERMSLRQMYVDSKNRRERMMGLLGRHRSWAESLLVWQATRLVLISISV